MLRPLSCLAFTLTIASLAPHAFADGRYARAPLSRLPAIQTWAEADAERYWLAGRDEVLYGEAQSEGDDSSAIFGGEWKSYKGDLHYFYGTHAMPEGSEEIFRAARVRVISNADILPESRDQHGGVSPFLKNRVLESSRPIRKNASETNQSMPGLSQWLDAVQWRADIATLAGFNRYSYGSGIENSKIWLQGEFAKLPGVALSEFPFTMPRGKGVNVLARIEGKSRPDEIYIVGAHYDAISEQSSVLAPGAEDNASGTAGLLALARIFAEHPPEATIIFAAFSGEEQGLYGSKAWTKDWLASGQSGNIKSVLIMDMIGYSGDEEQDLLLETSTLTKPILADINSVHSDPELVVSESFDYWGSDHEPFLDNGLPAILFIENDYLDYPAYHRSNDTIENIHPTLGPKILSLMTDSLALWVY